MSRGKSGKPSGSFARFDSQYFAFCLYLDWLRFASDRRHQEAHRDERSLEWAYGRNDKGALGTHIAGSPASFALNPALGPGIVHVDLERVAHGSPRINARAG